MGKTASPKARQSRFALDWVAGITGIRPVHHRALAAVQECTREVIEGALAALRFTAVAFQARLGVVGAPGPDVVALTPRTLEGPIFPAQSMDVGLTRFRGQRVGADAKPSTWLSFSLDHKFGEDPDRRFSAYH